MWKTPYFLVSKDAFKQYIITLRAGIDQKGWKLVKSILLLLTSRNKQTIQNLFESWYRSTNYFSYLSHYTKITMQRLRTSKMHHIVINLNKHTLKQIKISLRVVIDQLTISIFVSLYHNKNAEDRLDDCFRNQCTLWSFNLNKYNIKISLTAILCLTYYNA